MGIGDWVTDIFGSRNKTRAGAPALNSNAYQYGGTPGGAAAAGARFRGVADQAQTRGAEQANTAETAWDRNQAYQARQGQQGIASLMDARARGQVPSIAQMQADRQMGQAFAAQTAQAASARGGAGMAIAGQGAANNIANAHGAISGQAQVNAAQERLAAENAAFGAYSGMRGGDQQQQQQAAQQAQFQAQMNAQQRAQNDAVTQNNAQNEIGVNNSQLAAGMNQQAQQSANSLGASGINAGVGGQNAGMNQQNAWGLIGMGRDVAGAAGLGGGPKKADGGPVAGRQPYLVGERGPELIVPRKDGHVIPAEQTSRILSAARADGGPVSAGGAPTLAPSTWGSGGPDVRGQALAGMRADWAAGQARLAAQQAQVYEDPWTREARQLETLQRVSPDLVSEEDERKGEAARARLSMHRGDKATKAALAQKDRAVASAIPAGRGSDTLDRMQSVAPPQYHAGAGYVAPQMIPLPTRAFGGPISAGGDPFAAESFAGQSGMLGGSPLGELQAHSDFATRFQRSGGANPIGYGGEREEGGLIQRGLAYLVGERGPEAVVPPAGGAMTAAEHKLMLDRAQAGATAGGVAAGSTPATHPSQEITHVNNAAWRAQGGAPPEKFYDFVSDPTAYRRSLEHTADAMRAQAQAAKAERVKENQPEPEPDPDLEEATRLYLARQAAADPRRTVGPAPTRGAPLLIDHPSSASKKAPGLARMRK